MWPAAGSAGLYFTTCGRRLVVLVVLVGAVAVTRLLLHCCSAGLCWFVFCCVALLVCVGLCSVVLLARCARARCVSEACAWNEPSTPLPRPSLLAMYYTGGGATLSCLHRSAPSLCAACSMRHAACPPFRLFKTVPTIVMCVCVAEPVAGAGCKTRLESRFDNKNPILCNNHEIFASF